MLKVNSLHRRLPILIAADGNFYTPTTPKDYSEGQAIADVMSGRSSYSFQRLSIRNQPSLKRKGLRAFLERSRWVAGDELLEFQDFPKGWEIVEGRSWNTPKSITPEQAEDRRYHASNATSVG